MTVPTDLRRCTGHYTCASASYDALSNSFTDQSALGYHLPLKSGAPPAFINRAGVNCIDLTNSFYFEIENPIPCLGSVVFKMHTDAAGSPTGSLAICSWAKRNYPTGDHVALTPTPWEDADRRQMFYISPSAKVRATNFVGSDPSIDGEVMAINTWHVVTVVFNLAEFAAKVKVGAGATLVDIMGPPEPNTPPSNSEDSMRFGYLKASGGLTAPQHLSIAEIAFFHDDILVNQPELAAALVASWS